MEIELGERMTCLVYCVIILWILCKCMPYFLSFVKDVVYGVDPLAWDRKHVFEEAKKLIRKRPMNRHKLQQWHHACYDIHNSNYSFIFRVCQMFEYEDDIPVSGEGILTTYTWVKGVEKRI